MPPLAARDIQKWEYVPLGPFGAKNFATTISPWVVTLDALEAAACTPSSGPQVPAPLPYLADPAYGSYDVELEVDIVTPAFSAVVSRSNLRHMYWNARQQLAHHTVTGCAMAPGDLLGSGTISGPEPSSFGSMLELAWRGTKPLAMPDGSTRAFLADGDCVVMRGWAKGANGARIGFGECAGKILPATPLLPRGAPAGAKTEV